MHEMKVKKRHFLTSKKYKCKNNLADKKLGGRDVKDSNKVVVVCNIKIIDKGVV